MPNSSGIEKNNEVIDNSEQLSEILEDFIIGRKGIIFLNASQSEKLRVNDSTFGDERKIAPDEVQWCEPFAVAQGNYRDVSLDELADLDKNKIVNWRRAKIFSKYTHIIGKEYTIFYQIKRKYLTSTYLR